MSDEFVVRGGWARAYSRNGMSDFTGHTTPTLVSSITATRKQARATSSRPAAPRRCCSATTRSRPGRVPADAGVSDDRRRRRRTSACSTRHRDPVRRLVERRHPAEAVDQHGARSPLCRHAVADAWADAELQRDEHLENHFLDEFRAAQATCRPTSRPGRGATRSPTPVRRERRRCRHCSAFLNGASASRPATPPLYTGTIWTNTDAAEPAGGSQPESVRPGRRHHCTTRRSATQRAARAGIAAQLLRGQPGPPGWRVHDAELAQDATTTRCRSNCGGGSSQGLQFQSSYVFGKAMQSVFLTHRARRSYWQRDAGSPGT